MRPSNLPEAAYILHLILIYLGIQLCVCQEGNQHQQQAQYSEYQANNQDSAQYQDYNFEDSQKEELFCYSCSYHVRQGTAAGHENCRDPFIKTDISRMPCNGACAKIYHKISDTEYTITRICLPNCKDVADDKGYTQCCTGSLCNGGASGKSVSCLLLTSSLAASTWYTLR